MKVIKPQNKFKPMEEPVIEEKHPMIIEDDDIKQESTIEDLMDNLIQEQQKDKVTFSVTLTKRQYELYTQKGGICWLKKALVGQVKKKKLSKKR